MLSPHHLSGEYFNWPSCFLPEEWLGVVRRVAPVIGVAEDEEDEVIEENLVPFEVGPLDLNDHAGARGSLSSGVGAIAEDAVPEESVPLLVEGVPGYGHGQEA